MDNKTFFKNDIVLNRSKEGFNNIKNRRIIQNSADIKKNSIKNVIFPNNDQYINSNLPRIVSSEKRIFSHENSILNNEIDKELKTMDINNRIRELENRFLDFKSNFEKRVLSMLEENPQKYLRHIKMIEDNESILWKDNNQQIINLQRTIQDLEQKFDKKINVIDSEILDFQAKINENLNKNTDLERKIVEYNSKTPIYPMIEPIKKNKLDTTIEIKLIKESLSQEINKRDVFYKDIMNMYQEINSYIHKNDSEISQKLKKHKEDIESETNFLKESNKKLESYKSDKIISENEYLKSIINSIEKKMDEEIEKRINEHFENKKIIDQKIDNFKEEIKKDEKNFLINEKQYLTQIQESIFVLNQIIKGNKDQIDANLATTQTLFNENIKSLSKTMEILKENIFTKIFSIDKNSLEINNRLIDCQNGFHEHTININKTIDKEFGRIEKITLAFEEIMNNKLGEFDNKIEIDKKNNDFWKNNLENKSFEIFNEVSSAFKILKKEFFNEKIEKNNKINEISHEILEINKLNTIFNKNLDDKIINIENQLDYKMKETYIKSENNIKENIKKLREEFENNNKKLYEKTNKELIDNIYNLNNKFTNQIENQVKSIRNSQLEQIHDIEKQIHNTILINEKKINKTINTFMQENEVKNNDNQRNFNEIEEKIRISQLNNQENIKSAIYQSKNELISLNEQLKNDINIKLNDENLQNKSNINKFILNITNEFNSLKEFQKKDLFSLKEEIELSTDQKIGFLNRRFDENIDEFSKKEDLKLEELRKLIENNKKMLLESINQNSESNKALSRALVLEESAQREKSCEEILKILRKSIDSLENLLNNKLNNSIEKITNEINQMKNSLENLINENKIEILKEINRFKKEIEEKIYEINAEIYFNEIMRKLKENEIDENFKNFEKKILEIIVEIQNLYTDLKEENKERKEKDREIIDFINIQRDLLNENQKTLIEHNNILINNEENTENIKTILENHENLLLNHKEILEKHEEKIIIHSHLLEKHDEESVKIQDVLNHYNDIIYQMDDKFSKYIENVYIEMEARNYLNDLYLKMQEEENQQSITYLKNKSNKLTYQIKKLMERMQESDKIFDQFEIKTDNNFQIAEKAIKAHTKFLNEIDCRLTLEEIYNKVCHRNSEENFKRHLSVINEKIEGFSNKNNEDLKGNLNNQLLALKEIENKIRGQEKINENLKINLKNNTDAINAHTNFLNEIDSKIFLNELFNENIMNELENKQNNVQNNINEQLKIMEEQTEKLIDEKINLLEKKIEEDTIPHTILQMDETMKKLNKSNHDQNEEIARLARELQEKVKQHANNFKTVQENQKELESTILINATIQRASERNIMDYCKEGFDKTRKILSQLENISIDPPSGDDNSENIELIINKINDLQKEIAEIHDVLDTIDKKTFIGLINENEKKIEKKLNENKNSISDYNKKIGESLTKLQEQFEQLKSKIYVNSE